METQQDSTLQPGTGGTPTSPASGQAGGQPPSVDVEAVVAALEGNPKFQEILDRRFQSVKDKRINKIEKNQDDFRSKLERVNAWIGKGKSQEEALLLMEVEDSLLAQRAPQAEPQTDTPKPAGNRQANPTDYTATLQALGLDGSDAEVTEIIRSSGNPQLDLLNLKVQRSTRQQAPANPAQVLPAGSGGAVNVDLEAEYQQRLSKIRRGDARAVTALQIEYRKKAREAGVKFNH